jgi:transcriptional regulator with XRE-family HTH domain
MSPGAVAAWELGKGFPKVAQLIELAGLLNSTVGELLGETAEPGYGAALEGTIREIVRDEIAKLAEKLPRRTVVEVLKGIRAERKPGSEPLSLQGSPQPGSVQAQ